MKIILEYIRILNMLKNSSFGQSKYLIFSTLIEIATRT